MVSMSTSPSSGNNNHCSLQLIHDVKLSSVVPASITAEEKRQHQLTNMDLVMKLHYIKTVHFFERDTVQGLGVDELKKAMFVWLEMYYPICGRIRWSDGGGRPYVKCNDSGVRVVEAKCCKTMEEYWQLGIGDFSMLVYGQPLAHDFGFTPLVFMQLTKFECGGMSVGMSWAHILGDAFSASNCVNIFGKFIEQQNQLRHTIPFTKNSDEADKHNHPKTTSIRKSLKLLDPLGENWLIPNTHKMQNHTFHFPEELLSNYFLQKSTGQNKIKPFELISAVIWKSLAKIRGTDNEPKIVTVCKKGFYKSGDSELPSNRNQIFGIVEAPMNLRVPEADPLELAKLIAENFVDESEMVMELEENEIGKKDFMVYGANLTFVDLEELDLYGLQLKRRRPVLANLSIGGVGDEGAVLVVPDGGGGAKIVNVILPEFQLQGLKNELKEELGIF
ncbi:hypothetical protein ACJIZ3_019185 [Penstemon smallii]|uniref:Uncharacterized protein n=1 Tax=Penstemon smallii TaxID=265156 RepID=A0ABD3T1P7_9LAMI